MSAVARDYAFVVKEKKDAPPVPMISKEQLEAAKAAVSKCRRKK